ncbi:MAG: MBL fold metallo-hydrolase [Desulfobacterales bacterium]|nr:MBL fold metallo-hydrolase [Desulfobacterales bacterium]
MTEKQGYTHGLHDLGNGNFAWLQPDGSWGLNNAGLMVGRDKTVLVDTLYDLARTRAMAAAMAGAVPAAAKMDMVINTHANGDHCYGNQLFAQAEIVASKACAEEFATETPPQLMVDMLKAADQMGALGRYFADAFGRFDFEGIVLTPPTRTFQGELTLDIGGKTLRLMEVGPCHTRGDIMVWVPEDRLLFAGDILFVNGTPIMWDGPVGNWIGACERILTLDAETIVPGHGPLCGRAQVEAVRDYWRYLETAARQCHTAGMPPDEAARSLFDNPYAHWTDPERVAINVDALYREFNGDHTPANRVALFDLMARIRYGAQAA